MRGHTTLLAERGILVSYETVRRWVNHFGPVIAADLRKRRPKPHMTWHLDEVYLKIDGRLVYLWRWLKAENTTSGGLLRIISTMSSFMISWFTCSKRRKSSFVNCVPWRSLKALIISESDFSSSAGPLRGRT